MAIDLQNINNQTRATTAKQSSAGRTAKQLSNLQAIQSGSDAIRLTDTASILQNAERLVATLPVVSNPQISAITELLNDGNYRVNAGRVAEKIIEFEQGLPN